MTANEIRKDPTNYWNYLGFIPGLSIGMIKGCKKAANQIDNFNNVPNKMPKADRFPSRDATGRIHGDIPNQVPGNWRRGELQDAIAEVEASLAARRSNQIRFGEEARHRARIAEEEAWLLKLQRSLQGLP